MADVIRIKRRATGGGGGAPSTLANAELAYNEQTDILYYGWGTGGGGGSATTIKPIGGPGWAAPLDSPALTGTPTAPTAAVDTNTTQIATTAMVLGQAASANPIVDGTAAPGTSTRYARADHIHPSDTTREATANKGVANGYAGLDGTGKVPSGQLPSSVTGALVYQGTWNATTNSPALASGVGTQGFYYKVATAGTTSIDGNNQWNVGDDIVFDGTVWDKIDGLPNEVVSVAGRTGAVAIANTDVSGLGSMATQAASAVAITGGTIDGVTFDGGTF